VARATRGDRADVEIDLVAVNEEERRIRFGTCKRNAGRLPAAIPGLRRSAERFLTAHGRFGTRRPEFVAIAPAMPATVATALAKEGVIAESVSGLTRDL
jgi:hypothetical protein